MSPTLASDGYWIVTALGEVHAFGAAIHYGDLSGQSPASPIVGIVTTPIFSSANGDEGGDGYWLAAADGSVYAFGDAHYSGGAEHLPAGREIGLY